MTIWNCDVCEATMVPVSRDTILEMWLCGHCNLDGQIEEMELAETW